MRFTAKEIAKITKGRLCADPDIAVCGVQIDSRAIKEGDLFVALPGERVDGHRFVPSALEKGATLCLCREEMGKDVPCVIVPDCAAALGLIAKAWKERLSLLTVGVTGSVGKTTTKQMIASVLSEAMPTLFTEGNFNNELGLPLTLLRLDESHRAAVLEMGMSAFGEIAYLSSLACPDIGVVTCIGTSHIENLGSREGIRDAKMEIVSGMKEGSTLILNGDEPLLSGYDAIYVGLKAQGKRFLRCENLEKAQDGMHFDLVDENGTKTIDLIVPGAGEHLVVDAAMAFAVGLTAGMREETIRAGLLRFANTGMRQHIERFGDTKLIVDCYNAAPESMKAALSVLAGEETVGKRIAVLGDMRELGSHSASLHEKVGGYVAQAGVDLLLCFGPESEMIQKGAIAAGMYPDKTWHFADLSRPEDVTKKLKELALPGDTILFKASRGTELERVIEKMKEN